MAIGTIANGESGSSTRTKINAAFAVLDAGVAVFGTNIFTDLQTITQGTANKGVIASTGYSLTGSDATPMLDFAGTWNTTGNSTGLKINITNTASGANARLLELGVGGNPVCSVSKTGQGTFSGGSYNVPSVVLSGYYGGAPENTGFGCGEVDLIHVMTHNGGTFALFAGLPHNLTLSSDTSLSWAGTSTLGNTAGTSLVLEMKSAAILGLGSLAATTPVAQAIAAHDVTTGTGASLTLSGGTGSVAGGALILGASATTGAPAAIMTLKASGHINVTGIPTSASGLAAGDLWSNGGVLTVA